VFFVFFQCCRLLHPSVCGIRLKMKKFFFRNVN